MNQYKLIKLIERPASDGVAGGMDKGSLPTTTASRLAEVVQILPINA